MLKTALVIAALQAILLICSPANAQNDKPVVHLSQGAATVASAMGFR